MDVVFCHVRGAASSAQAWPPTKSNRFLPKTNQNPPIPVVKAGVFLLYWKCLAGLWSLAARKKAEPHSGFKVEKRHLTRYRRCAIL